MFKVPHEVPITNQDNGDSEKASILLLTPAMARRRIAKAWWTDARLSVPHDFEIVDREWDWEEAAALQAQIQDFPGRIVALLSAGGDVEGAMGISTTPTPSKVTRRGTCLKIEGLATAPRNRDELTNNHPLYRGVGYNLIRWGVALSNELGCSGRILLHASPDAVEWYINRGFRDLGLGKEDLGGIPYLPMELTVRAAQVLLSEERGSR